MACSRLPCGSLTRLGAGFVRFSLFAAPPEVRAPNPANFNNPSPMRQKSTIRRRFTTTPQTNVSGRFRLVSLHKADGLLLNGKWKEIQKKNYVFTRIFPDGIARTENGLMAVLKYGAVFREI